MYLENVARSAIHLWRLLHEGDLLSLGFRKDAKAHNVAFGIRARSRT